MFSSASKAYLWMTIEADNRGACMRVLEVARVQGDIKQFPIFTFEQMLWGYERSAVLITRNCHTLDEPKP